MEALSLNDDKYGKCACCNENLLAIWFIEYEQDRYGIRTGRQRYNIDYLECLYCGKRYVVDDSYARPWHYEYEQEE